MKNIVDLLTQINNKRLLVIFPHPDDESVMAAGLIQKAISMNWQVKVICVTNGTLGQVHIHGRGRSVVQIRKSELAQAMKILGVVDYEMWRFCDGLLSEIDIWKQEVSELIYSWKPGLVLTYGPDGISGHPDHIVLGREVLLAVKKIKDAILLWPSFSQQVRRYIVSAKVIKRHSKPQYQLTLKLSQAYNKWRAINAHRSQKIGNNLPVPLFVAGLVHPYEHFAVADLKKNYNFELVEFDLGNY